MSLTYNIELLYSECSHSQNMTSHASCYAAVVEYVAYTAAPLSIQFWSRVYSVDKYLTQKPNLFCCP